MSGDGITVGRWLIPETELEERFETSGGPGGQHANRTESAVALRFYVHESSLPDDVKAKVTGRLGDRVEVVAADSRSQWRNRALARQRLREKLEAALVDPPTRKTTRTPRRAKERRLAEKKARSELKKTRRKPDPD